MRDLWKRGCEIPRADRGREAPDVRRVRGRGRDTVEAEGADEAGNAAAAGEEGEAGARRCERFRGADNCREEEDAHRAQGAGRDDKREGVVPGQGGAREVGSERGARAEAREGAWHKVA